MFKKKIEITETEKQAENNYTGRLLIKKAELKQKS
jgi:diphthamide synthase (EF-2-diphthine--ammonia ligase)